MTCSNAGIFAKHPNIPITQFSNSRINEFPNQRLTNTHSLDLARSVVHTHRLGNFLALPSIPRVEPWAGVLRTFGAWVSGNIMMAGKTESCAFSTFCYPPISLRLACHFERAGGKRLLWNQKSSAASRKISLCLVESCIRYSCNRYSGSGAISESTRLWIFESTMNQ